MFFCLGGARADEVPATFTYQGRLLNASGTAPLISVVDLKFQILSPSGTCLLYEELQTGVDLSTSSGVFSVRVGSNLGSTKRTASDPGLTMAHVLGNAGSVVRGDDSGSTNTCPGGYTPSNGDSRSLRVTVIDGGIPTVLTPDQTIGSQPYAIVAQTLQGLGPNGFIRANGAADLTQANAELLVSGNDASLLHDHDSLYVKKGDSVNQDLGSGDVLTTGRIGIGTTSPLTDIEIERTNPTFRMDAASGGGGNSQIQFYSGSTERARIESPETTGELRIYTNGIAAITIDANQNANFTSNVRLKGFLDLGDYDNTQEGTLSAYLTGTCGVACAGSIWFNTDLGLLRYWDGSGVATLGDSSNKLSIDGSIAMTGDLNLDGNKIINVGAPVANNDAANKAYVDGAIGAVSTAVSGDFVDRDGSTALTGNWNVGGFDLNNLGNVSIAAQKTLGVGHLNNTQESTLVSGFGPAHTGKVWYNTDTNTLNVWTGSSAQSLGVVGGSIANLNGETGSSQTFATPGSSGNAPHWVSATNVHTLNIPLANTSGVTAGLVSKAEFDDFNQKQDGDAQLDDIAAIDPSATGGSYVYSDGTNLVTRTTANLKADLSLGSMADETATDYLLRDGSLSMTGNLDLAGHSVNNLATPVAATDATTKAYVDAAVGAISTSASGAYLTIADNLSDLNNIATARTNLGLGSMAEEDATNYLLRDGSLSMTGDLNLSGHNITGVNSIAGTSAIFGSVTLMAGAVKNLSSPLDSKDAANKGYVDTQIAAVSTAADGNYLAIAGNLSDLNSTATARTNLGVEIGADVQAYDEQLSDIAGIDPATTSGSYIYSNGVNLSTRTVSDLKTDLSLGSMADEMATDYLLRDGTLSMTGALNLAGNDITTVNSVTGVSAIFGDVTISSRTITNLSSPSGETDATSKGYVDAQIAAVSMAASGSYLTISDNLSDLANATTARANLGVEIGTDVQAFDMQLTDIAAINPATTSGSYIYSDGSNLVTRTVANLKTDLSLGTMADESASDYLKLDGTSSMTGNINLNGNYLSGDGGNEGVFIDSSGNMGIGTTNPSNLMHLEKASGEEGFPGIFISDPTQVGSNYGGGLYYEDRAGLNGLKMSVTSAGAESGYVYLSRDSGKVGIGTTAPGTILTVSNASPEISFHDSTSDKSGSIQFQDGDLEFWVADSAGKPSTLGTQRMILDRVGNLGVGVTDPEERLEVAGNAKLNGLPIGTFNPYTGFAVSNQDYRFLIDDMSGTYTYSPSDGGIKTTDSTWFFVKTRLPVDENATYKASLRVKKLSGDGRVYLGAVSLDENFNVLQTDLASSYNYFAASSELVAVGEEKTFTGIISGFNTTAEASRNKFDPGAKYFDLVVITNYGGSGETVVKSIEVEKLPIKEAWQSVTFQNGWENYGSSYNPAGYTIDKSGFVRLRGMVKNGTAGNGVCVFTLPVGYRPSHRQLMASFAAGNTAARIDVDTSGCVMVYVGSASWTTLDNLSFRADQ